MNTVLITILIILILYQLYEIHKKEMFGLGHTTYKMGIDGIRYRVHGGVESAHVISQLNIKMVELMRNLRDIYITRKIPIPTNEIDLGPYNRVGARVDVTRNILARYNPDNIYESSPHNAMGDTSFTVQKGKVLAMCVRDKNDNIEPLDKLIFVNIHEMAHIAIDDVDHNKLFWQTFKFLLWSAAISGIYMSPDFRNSPTTYCGEMNINFNPLYDG